MSSDLIYFHTNIPNGFVKVTLKQPYHLRQQVAERE